jgi:hypothetical protein
VLPLLPRLEQPRRRRELPLAATGRPGPWGAVAPAFLAALAGWAAAALALVANAGDLAGVATWDDGLVLAVHLTGLVLFPFAVTGAAWHVLPSMLRVDLPGERRLDVALVLALGGVVLATGVARDDAWLVAVGSAALAGALALVASTILSLVRRAPRGRLLVASRTGVVLAVAHAVVAFALGAALVVWDGVEALGVPRDRLTLVHLLVAALGWLAVLLLAVGRVLGPMLALAPHPPHRRFPVAEVVFVAALWPALAGLAAGWRWLALLGLAGLLGGVASFGAIMARAAVRGRIGYREAPLAHLLFGLLALVEAGVVGALGLLGVLDERRAGAVVGTLAVGAFAAGLLVGYAGKLLSLSAWASWPPGPRPKQEALYPRQLWQVEVAAFAVGAEVLAAGVLADAAAVASAGAAVVATSALLALAGGVATIRRVAAALASR